MGELAAQIISVALLEQDYFKLNSKLKNNELVQTMTSRYDFLMSRLLRC